MRSASHARATCAQHSPYACLRSTEKRKKISACSAGYYTGMYERVAMIKYFPEVQPCIVSVFSFHLKRYPTSFVFFFIVLPFQVLFPSFPQHLNFLNLIETYVSFTFILRVLIFIAESCLATSSLKVMPDCLFFLNFIAHALTFLHCQYHPKVTMTERQHAKSFVETIP